jgi:hypothetical protein
LMAMTRTMMAMVSVVTCCLPLDSPLHVHV